MDAKTAKTIWVYSPLIDCATVLSGLTLCILFAVIRPFFSSMAAPFFFLVLMQILAMFHSWSTTYLVVGSKLFAPLRAQDPDRFVKIPLLILLFSLILGILVAKTVVIPETPTVDSQSFLYYFLFCGTFMFGHFWHFGRQDFGVLSLYRNRAGQNTFADRRSDDIFTKLMMYGIQPLIYLYAFSIFPFTVLVLWLVPIRDFIEPIATGAIAVAILAYAVVCVAELRKQNRSLPKILYYTVMLFHPLFLYGSQFTQNARVPFIIYWQISYMISHWVISVFLSQKIHVGFLVKTGSSMLQANLKHFAVIGAITALLSWGASYMGAFAILSGRDFISVRVILKNLRPEETLLVGIFLGITLAEQLLHYWCDRCLFRFQDPKIREQVTPFL